MIEMMAAKWVVQMAAKMADGSVGLSVDTLVEYLDGK